jgi:hypothetical protein
VNGKATNFTRMNDSLKGKVALVTGGKEPIHLIT